MRQKSQVRGMRSRRSRRLAVNNIFLQPEQPEVELHDIQSPPIHVTPLATAVQILSDSSPDRSNAPLNAPKQSQSPCSSFVRSAASYMPNQSPADGSSDCTTTKKKKRGRGPTCMLDIWEQLGDQPRHVSFNSLGQPNDAKNTSILANFLGTLARNGENAPLHYMNWRKMPESYKEDMMKIVKLKFDIPEIGEEFIIKSLANKWRNWKCTLKKMYFDPMKSVEEHLSKVPERVDKEQWKHLVIYWSSEEGKNISESNKTTRKKQVVTHCRGTRSFAVVKEMEKKKLGRDPSRADMFIACYAKPDGTPVNPVIGEKIEKMKELLSKDIEGSSGGIDMDGTDVYEKVMGKDKPGFIRTYGLGVTFPDLRGGKRRRASYALALEYKSAFEKMERQCGELTKKLEEMQNNSGGVQTPSPNPPNCFLATTSVCKAIKMATSLQEDYWSTEHLELFCKLCIEQIDKKGSHLNEGVWNKISDKFEQLTGKKHDSAEMKNTWDNLKEEWENWKQLMKGEAEMGWDFQKQTVGASEEWWKRKIQMNPAFKNFRAKGIPPDFESLLDRMFMDVEYGAWKGSQDSPSNFNNDFMPVDHSGSDMNSNYNDDIDRDIGEIIAQLNKGKEVEPQEEGTFSPASNGDFAAAAAADSYGCMISKDADQSNAEAARPRKSKKPNKIEKLKVKMMMKKKKKKSRGGESSKLKKQLDKIYSAVESKSVTVAVAAPAPDRPSAVEPNYDEIMEMLDEIPEIEGDDDLHFFALDHLKERLNQVIFMRFKNHDKRTSWLKHEFKKQRH